MLYAHSWLLRLSALLAVFFLSTLPGSGQSWYWVEFSDKAGSPFSIERPLEFLSGKSIDRRVRQQIPLDEHDLPVNNSYTDSIRNAGGQPLHASRWLNGITVRAEHDSVVDAWKKFRFVKQVELVRPSDTPLKKASTKFSQPETYPVIDTALYGQSVHQVSMLNGHYFHRNGIRGAGMLIAVLDAGFLGANEIPGLAHLYQTGRIAGTRDFVNPVSDIYTEHPHGMMVLSCMAGVVPGQLIGTAPDASYLLVRTEDDASEYRIEEYNWIAGAEYADSMGADIINSSLGYSVFDDTVMNYRYEDMDGQTTRVTRGANMAASRGMLVFFQCRK
jgi:serine protease AprX